MSRWLIPTLCLFPFILGCGKPSFSKLAKEALTEMNKLLKVSAKSKDATQVQGTVQGYTESYNRLMELRTELSERMPEAPLAKQRVLRKYTPAISAILMRLGAERDRLYALAPPQAGEAGGGQQIDPREIVPSPLGQGLTLKSCVQAGMILDRVIKTYEPFTYQRPIVKLPEWK